MTRRALDMRRACRHTQPQARQPRRTTVLDVLRHPVLNVLRLDTFARSNRETPGNRASAGPCLDQSRPSRLEPGHTRATAGGNYASPLASSGPVGLFIRTCWTRPPRALAIA